MKYQYKWTWQYWKIICQVLGIAYYKTMDKEPCRQKTSSMQCFQPVLKPRFHVFNKYVSRDLKLFLPITLICDVDIIYTKLQQK